jgi:hypothetical protein
MVFHRRRGTLAFSRLPQGEVADTVQQWRRHHPDNFLLRLPLCVLQAAVPVPVKVIGRAPNPRRAVQPAMRRPAEMTQDACLRNQNR